MFFFVKGVVDSVLDWVLYDNLNSVEEGLVVGPFDCRILQSLFLFCCIGTVVSVIDIANRFYDLRTGTPFVDIRFTEVVILYFEDIPQLIIGIIIIGCRGNQEGAIAIVKAVFVFLALCAAMFISQSNMLNMTSESKTDKNKKNNCVWFTYVGTIFAAIIALVTFIFTSNPQNTYEQFFSKVGIYGHISDLLSPFDELGNITWIKMFDINDILNQNFFTIQVTTYPNYIRLQNFYSDVRRTETDRCYMFNRNGAANDIAI